MTDLDQRIVHTLQERAEGSVDTDRLLVGAVARGRARVRRRRAAGALGVVALLGVGVLTGPVGRLPGVNPAPVPGLPGPAEAAVPLVPPRVDGAPGAAARPDRIGTDPTQLHIGLAPGGPRFLEWNVRGRVETAKLDVGGRTVTVELTSAEVLRSGGAWDMPLLGTGSSYDGSVVHTDGPDGVPIWRRYWQPAPGVYAGASVAAPDKGPLHDVAAALRLDQAYACAGPLRLTDLPAGAQVTGCRMVVGTFPAAYAVVLDVSNDDDQTMMWVELQYAGTTVTGRAPANRTIGGRPAHFDPTSERLELLDIPRVQLFATLASERDFTEAEAGAVLVGASVAEHLDRPATW